MEPEQRKAILQIVWESTSPLGWYGIGIRLGTRGIRLSKKLPTLLKELVKAGLLTHSQAEGHPHGVYSLTDLGHTQLKP